MKLAWGKAVDQDFRDAVLTICDKLGWPHDPHASWLMACMAFETAETFRPTIRNAAGSGAIGLIQFMPNTAEWLGTTTEKLAAMTAVEQLEFVRKHFEPYAARIATLSDMYMAILLPKYVGALEDSVLFQAPKTSYRQNAGLDANRDGKITKAEATAKVQAKLDKGMRDEFAEDV